MSKCDTKPVGGMYSKLEVCTAARRDRLGGATLLMRDIYRNEKVGLNPTQSMKDVTKYREFFF